jgi:hypothetical protein
MTPFEAKRALGEMSEKIGPEHTREVELMINEREEELKQTSSKDQPCDAS